MKVESCATSFRHAAFCRHSTNRPRFQSEGLSRLCHSTHRWIWKSVSRCGVALVLLVVCCVGKAQPAGERKQQEEVFRRAYAALPVDVDRFRATKRFASPDFWAPEPLSEGRFLEWRETSPKSRKTSFIIRNRRNRQTRIPLDYGISVYQNHVSFDGKQFLFVGGIEKDTKYQQGTFIIEIATGILHTVADRVDPGQEAWLADNRHWLRMTWLNDDKSARFDVYDYDKPGPANSFEMPVPDDCHLCNYSTRSNEILLMCSPDTRFILIDPATRKQSVLKPPFYLGWPIVSPDGRSILFVRDSHTRPPGNVLATPKRLPPSPTQYWISLYTMRIDGNQAFLHDIGYFPNDHRPDQTGLSEREGFYSNIKWTPDGKSICFRCFGWICTAPAWK